MLTHSSSLSEKRKLKCTTPSSEAELLNLNPKRLSFRSSTLKMKYHADAGCHHPDALAERLESHLACFKEFIEGLKSRAT